MIHVTYVLELPTFSPLKNNTIFYPLELVSGYRDPQLQVIIIQI